MTSVRFFLLHDRKHKQKKTNFNMKFGFTNVPRTRASSTPHVSNGMTSNHITSVYCELGFIREAFICAIIRE